MKIQEAKIEEKIKVVSITLLSLDIEFDMCVEIISLTKQMSLSDTNVLEFPRVMYISNTKQLSKISSLYMILTHRAIM